MLFYLVYLTLYTLLKNFFSDFESNLDKGISFLINTLVKSNLCWQSEAIYVLIGKINLGFYSFDMIR